MNEPQGQEVEPALEHVLQKINSHLYVPCKIDLLRKELTTK